MPRKISETVRSDARPADQYLDAHNWFKGATRGFKCSIKVCQSLVAAGVRGKFNGLSKR